MQTKRPEAQSFRAFLAECEKTPVVEKKSEVNKEVNKEVKNVQ